MLLGVLPALAASPVRPRPAASVRTQEPAAPAPSDEELCVAWAGEMQVARTAGDPDALARLCDDDALLLAITRGPEQDATQARDFRPCWRLVAVALAEDAHADFLAVLLETDARLGIDWADFTTLEAHARFVTSPEHARCREHPGQRSAAGGTGCRDP
jgi:hypothetical protein